MTRFVWRAMLAAMILLAAMAPGAAASSITIEATSHSISEAATASLPRAPMAN